jgi:diketogulonate reductase-like aldo/keto reductase
VALVIEREIPSTGERIPLIGLGTWQTFDVRNATPLVPVVEAFAAAGGRVIDSSPMYGRAEETVGILHAHVSRAFLATKVWTRGRAEGIAEMERSMRLLRTDVVDLMQIHNLLDWRIHLGTLRDWKAQGRIRYLGITHYTTGAFADLASILRCEAVDFVQLPLSIGVPDAARRLLPLARERRVAVLVNRPFEEGALLRRLRGRPLPPWAADFDCRSWSELFLRWIVAHEEVTCVIPATSSLQHMRDNLRAGEGRTLDAEERRRLRELVLASSG